MLECKYFACISNIDININYLAQKFSLFFHNVHSDIFNRSKMSLLQNSCMPCAKKPVKESKSCAKESKVSVLKNTAARKQIRGLPRLGRHPPSISNLDPAREENRWSVRMDASRLTFVSI